MKTPRTYKQAQQDPRVADWSDERTGGIYNEGIWLYLAPGWVTDEGLLTIHEVTVRECCECLKWCRYSPEEYLAGLGVMDNHKPHLLPAG